MLLLTMQTEYALLALGYLARVVDRRLVSAREIAAHYNIPPELLAKLLQRCSRDGLVRSTPGPNGGYALTCSLHEVTVADVLRVVEGRLPLVRCAGENCCQVANACDISEPMRHIHARLVDVLERVPLSEIFAETAEIRT